MWRRFGCFTQSSRFFSIAVQRTTLQAASSCCRNVSFEHFPIIRSCLALFGPVTGRICLPLHYLCGWFLSPGLDQEPWIIGWYWYNQSSKSTASTSWRFPFDHLEHVYITLHYFSKLWQHPHEQVPKSLLPFLRPILSIHSTKSLQVFCLLLRIAMLTRVMPWVDKV